MSTFLTLNWKDLGKGFLVAILGALLTGVYQALQAGTIAFTWVFWQPIVFTAATAGIGYIIKNFLTNSQDQFAKPEIK